MSMIKKCDRCGKEITLESRVPRILNHHRVIESRIIFGLYDSHRYDGERDLDLCRECDESFIDWFNAGTGSRKLKK